MNTISLTLDATSRDALLNGANQLTLLANNINLPTANTTVSEPDLTPAAPEPQKNLDEMQASPEGQAMGFAPPPEIVGVDLDGDGLPHDLRIHGKARKKTQKDDLWIKIRGVDPALVVQVEAELRAALAATPPTSDPTPPPEAENTTMIDQVNAEHDAPPPPAPAAATPPPPASPEPASPEPVETLYLHGGKEFTEKQLQDAGWNDAQIGSLEVVNAHVPDTVKAITFPELMAKITTGIGAGSLTTEAVDAACKAQGLESRPLLGARPDLVPVIDKLLFG